MLIFVGRPDIPCENGGVRAAFGKAEIAKMMTREAVGKVDGERRTRWKWQLRPNDG